MVLSGSATLNLSGSLHAGTYTIASYVGNLTGEFTTLNIPLSDTISYGTGTDSAITLTVTPGELRLDEDEFDELEHQRQLGPR